jgi:hypothetical protein
MICFEFNEVLRNQETADDKKKINAGIAGHQKMTQAWIQEMLKKHSHDADKPDAIQLAVIIMTYYIRFIFGNCY